LNQLQMTRFTINMEEELIGLSSAQI